MKDNPLIGKTVKKVYLAQDGGAIRFDLADGESLVVQADGDCCSHSWIENVQGLEQLLESPVVSVEDIPMPAPEGPPLMKGELDRYTHNRYGHYEDEMAYYGCRITTEKGFAVIDYRNSSNGYYGGNLSWPGEYFYGGVHNQNVSKEEWREVTE